LKIIDDNWRLKMKKMMYHKIRSEYVLITVFGILAFAFVMQVGTVGASYSYMNINIAGTAQDGYQVNFAVPWESGMNADFSNVRFFANNINTDMSLSLPYWIESQTNGESANVWIPLPANCHKVFCVWNLNGQITSQSDITQVMDFGDDFTNENSLDKSRWTSQSWGVSGTTTVGNGYLYNIAPGGQGDALEAWTSNKGTTTGILSLSMQAGENPWINVGLSGPNYKNVCELASLPGNTQKWVTSYSSVTDGNRTIMNRKVSTSDSFHRVDCVYVQGVKAQFYMDGILDATSTTNLPTGTLYAVFQSGSYRGGDQITLKWICIRKYNATPPSVTVDPTVYPQPTLMEEPQYTPTDQPQYTPKQPQPTPTGQPKSPSISLHGEKTNVTMGEDILLKLSAVNLITKPTMHTQVILIPPSGMSVSSSDFVDSGAGQYTAKFELEPGDGKDIEVRIKANQVGNFDVKGRVVYYYGENKTDGYDYPLDLPIQVSDNFPTPTPTPSPASGFGAVSLVFILMTIFILRRD
jgi:hypothetical protein